MQTLDKKCEQLSHVISGVGGDRISTVELGDVLLTLIIAPLQRIKVPRDLEPPNKLVLSVLIFAVVHQQHNLLTEKCSN